MKKKKETVKVDEKKEKWPRKVHDFYELGEVEFLINLIKNLLKSYLLEEEDLAAVHYRIPMMIFLLRVLGFKLSRWEKTVGEELYQKFKDTFELLEKKRDRQEKGDAGYKIDQLKKIQKIIIELKQRFGKKYWQYCFDHGLL